MNTKAHAYTQTHMQKAYTCAR